MDSMILQLLCRNWPCNSLLYILSLWYVNCKLGFSLPTFLVIMSSTTNTGKGSTESWLPKGSYMAGQCCWSRVMIVPCLYLEFFHTEKLQICSIHRVEMMAIIFTSGTVLCASVWISWEYIEF